MVSGQNKYTPTCIFHLELGFVSSNQEGIKQKHYITGFLWALFMTYINKSCAVNQKYIIYAHNIFYTSASYFTNITAAMKRYVKYWSRLLNAGESDV